ncbi:hypothetical protein V501_03538 [Pseudogymnoascus sp. VKM F-4519 (FW-2642)]|nr:hypothetical protein V501_03538 [Pseudogymnoascus sp. VKM F-4519 (FW-2642)]
MAQTSPPAAQKHIVVLGGSYGGVSIAHYLLKHAIPKLPSPASYQIILISPSEQTMCRPACPRVLISDDLLPISKVFVNIPEVFTQYPAANFRFLHGKATALDHTSRSVSVALSAGGTETLTFHSLVLATGATTTSPLFGLNRDDIFLRARWAEFRESLATAKSIVIAGGGPSGVETAGELGEYLNGRAGWFSSKLENPKVKITLVTSAAQILPLLRASIATKAEGLLAQVGVTVVKNTRVAGVVPEGAGTESVGSKATVTLADGTTLEADLYIPAVGTQPNTDFVDKSLLTADGRVETNAATLRVDGAGSRVYAIGDVASYSRPAIHLTLAAIPILGANIKRDLLLDAGVAETAVGDDRVYVADKRETQLVPIGTSKGVGAAMGYEFPSFMIWLIKGRDYWLWTVGGLWSGKEWNKEK